MAREIIQITGNNNQTYDITDKLLSEATTVSSVPTSSKIVLFNGTTASLVDFSTFKSKFECSGSGSGSGSGGGSTATTDCSCSGFDFDYETRTNVNGGTLTGDIYNNSGVLTVPGNYSGDILLIYWDTTKCPAGPTFAKSDFIIMNPSEPAFGTYKMNRFSIAAPGSGREGFIMNGNSSDYTRCNQVTVRTT